MAKTLPIFLLLGTTLAASAVDRLNIRQLEQLLGPDPAKRDAKLAQQLSELELTERLSAAELLRLDAAAPGPQTRQTLQLLADRSVFLSLPTEEIPSTPRPTLTAQRQIIALAAAFAKKTLSSLPNFYATRETIRYEDNPRDLRGLSTGMYQALRQVNSSKDTVLYRDGHEVVNVSAADRKNYGLAEPGLFTEGLFGPILSTVLVDVAHGELLWSGWEQGQDGVDAVFRYKIPREASHYQIKISNVFSSRPAYHGVFAVNPADGSIRRLTIEADLKADDPIAKSDILVEYGSVEIGGKTYICPLKSISIMRAPAGYSDGSKPGNPRLATSTLYSTRVSGALRTSLNATSFTQYHLFRADVRMLTDDLAHSSQPGPAGPGAANSTAVADRPSVDSATPTASEPDKMTSVVAAPALPDSSAAFQLSAVPPAVVAALPKAVVAPQQPIKKSMDAQPAPTFRVSSRAVYVDVVVRDGHDRVVSGLSQDDFRVWEDGSPQKIDSFRAVIQKLAQSPPSGAPPAPPAGSLSAANTLPQTLNIVLLDLLDTSPVNQSFARSQMLKFLGALPPGQEIGLFVLTGRQLRMVQDFTGDSSKLAEAARKLLPESSLLYQSASEERRSNDATGTMPGLATPGGNDNSIILDLAQELKGENFQHGQVRNDFVVDAFRSLAKSIESFPGRKNLFWLAGSFPLSASSEMLTASRIAVYPISVLGMETDTIGAEMNGNGVTTGAPGLANGGQEAQLDERRSSSEDLRGGAEQIAAQTGGQAFVGMNDLAGALRHGLESGENYYSLIYSPTNKNQDGKFRKIRVDLARKGYSLSYRKGYFTLPTSVAPLTTQK